MSDIKKMPITAKWLKIKKMYEENTNGKREFGENFEPGGELDTLALDFAEMLGDITYRFGFKCTVEDIKMDLWKERIWNLIQAAGLLRTSPTHIGVGEYERDEERMYSFEDKIEDFIDEDKFDKEIYENLKKDGYVGSIEGDM
jgi:hypothetical protein